MPRRADLAGLALVALALAFPAGVHAQARTVVSKEVSVGRSASSLRLELDGGEALAIGFENGSVRVNGESIGSYATGDPLDVAWRELLGRAVSLDDGPLAVALVEWSPPASLAGGAAAAAAQIDRALEAALTAASPQAASDLAVSVGDPQALVRLVLDRGRRELIDDALRNVGDDARVELGTDVVIAADETVAGDLVVLGGSARIEGEVEGDVVVVGGELELLEGSVVGGDVRLAGARLIRNQGEVEGDVVEVRDEAPSGADVREEIRAQVIDDIRAEVRSELRGRERRASRSPFRSIAAAFGDLLENFVTILVLGLIGAAAVSFGGERIDVIAETARRAPGRSAAVGAAGTILLVPAWILGFIALVVSIVGIPVAIAWLPLFPIAACLAALIGYLAVARNAGEWLADSDLPWTHWIRRSNSLLTMIGGLLGLMAFFVVANVVSLAPFLRFLEGLLVAAGVLATIAAIQIGFGSVILTRGGRRRDYARYSADEAWEAAMKVEVDEDVGEPKSTEEPVKEERGDA